MQKAALLYNPASGGNHSKREEELEAALRVLRGAGVDVELTPTSSRTDAAAKARYAIAQGCDTVFACGGDGTIHDIVQVLANSRVALAILPLGTANALAHDLRIPLNLVGAAKTALNGTPRRIALGLVNYLDREGNPASRYFTVAAGMGIDAHLFFKLNTTTKRRLGMAAYYAKAWRLWFSHIMIRFLIEYVDNESGNRNEANVTELLAVRIRNFGGVLRELAPGASLDRNDFRLVFASTASRLSYLLYVIRGLLRQRWRIPGIQLAYSTNVCCRYLPRASATGESEGQPPVYVEADGELLGTIPADITIVPDALTILAPAGNR
jgi:diacylglycerol kinase (ATP)